ncbi:pyrroloquinoline quinone biosynthesis protein PqqC [Candidatus Methylacidiphilum fumarolicum]|uniref:Pyrroloquinoline-quinone synthase n=2 Tax=Candidatus Methylacidiphilum fumarolicum TaxID=591154 RepID=I0JZV4_METFB|nr:pyrroloquinoline-quinone synthase PqqC [Candidatus Methylacidiphilum fumarolicum]MBW6415806.1 pyrroloquinoline-quinone synthase PqqC [Candidatus Methylacidiphilum fumarolicum]TFE71981.1 pyrroloquinoline quinone biosynthesis protein PqqC [Candidatus Methylacidiphilum fumarolicum]TFE73851.1 pyrroloquinoline quinone biosynthesis protein PqqC [Candidatus Methylacidiphilum fumarolicum]CAI9085805.1 Pyrroloquinoline-quinone synthase [Candidatus Methylacidiphilum fumarolicum]CCG92773.1 coenzyme PQQ
MNSFDALPIYPSFIPKEEFVSKLPLPPAQFEEVLRSIGNISYHDKHPFHLLMNEGKLSKEALQGWVANRFYYQEQIPIKDAAILSNCPERELRRIWISRIHDHDGFGEDPGGIERWLNLGKAVGLSREDLLSHRFLLPTVRYAVDAYVHFCRGQHWLIAMASSLTELFAPTIHRIRISAFPKYYPWIDPEGLKYFEKRVEQAPKDVRFTLDLVLKRCTTQSLQLAAIEALQFKCDLLWSMLDALYMHYQLGICTPKPPYAL